MGLFHVTCTVVNPSSSRRAAALQLMVDTGAESTWVDGAALESIGIARRKKDLQFQLANGQIVTRSAGYAVLKVGDAETVDEVVFAEPGDLQLLGARALEGLNLRVDSRAKQLVAAGPIVAGTTTRVNTVSWLLMATLAADSGRPSSDTTVPAMIPVVTGGAGTALLLTGRFARNPSPSVAASITTTEVARCVSVSRYPHESEGCSHHWRSLPEGSSLSA